MGLIRESLIMRLCKGILDIAQPNVSSEQEKASPYLRCLDYADVDVGNIPV